MFWTDWTRVRGGLRAVLATAVVCSAGCATVVEIAPVPPQDPAEPDLTIPALTFEQLNRQSEPVQVDLPAVAPPPAIDFSAPEPTTPLPNLPTTQLPLNDPLGFTDVTSQPLPLEEVVLEELQP